MIMKARSFPLFIMMLATCLGAAAAQAAEPIEFYNPRAEMDDVMIPMPCNFKMVFRKVYTSLEQNKIKDKTFNAGLSGSEDLISQSPHEMHVQGAFRDKTGYYYLISKYEVSGLQYDTLVSDKCPDLVRINALPKVNISWFEAVDFTRRFSLYLNSQEGQQDDFVKSNTGIYVRLPNEAEWEFASRGGLQVSLAEFQSPVPPIKSGALRDLAFFGGAQSSNGKLNVSGLLQPNPLKIYDMLGNAQEMILEPFSATRTGRLHGQDGGFIIRGGGFLTNQKDVTSALRIEKPYYINGKELRAKDIGMRLVVSKPVIADRQELAVLNDEISKLGHGDEIVKDSRRDKSNLDRLDAIIRQNHTYLEQRTDLENKNSSLLRSLNDLRQELVKANAARDEQRDKSIVSSLRLGGNLCAYISSSKQSYEETAELFSRLAKICQTNTAMQSCNELDSMMARRDGEFEVYDYFVNYYADHLVETATLYEFASVKAKSREAMLQIQNVSKEHRTYPGAKKVRLDVGKNLSKNVSIFLDHIKAYSPNTDFDLLKKDIIEKCGTGN